MSLFSSSDTKSQALTKFNAACSANVVFLSGTVTSDAAGAIGYGATAPSGSNVTTAVQAAVDSVPDGGVLVWDVAVGLSAPILIPSNITIWAPGREFGAILRAAANCPMFRNLGITTDATTSKQKTFGQLDPDFSGNAAYRLLETGTYINNRNITFIGGTWNGNRAEQTGHPFTATYGFLSTFQFWGVEDVTLRDILVLRPMSALPVHFCNWHRVNIYNCEVDGSPINSANVGGEDSMAAFQMNGPGRTLRIQDIVTHVEDDHVALNADDSAATAINNGYAGGSSVCTPGTNWVQCGDITDVRIRNHRITDGIEGVPSHGAMRLFTSVHLIDDVIVENQSGAVEKFAYNIGPISGMQISGVGNLGDIRFINNAVELTDPDLDAHGVGNAVFDIRSSFKRFEISGITRGAVPSGSVPYVGVEDPTTGTIAGKSLIVQGDFNDTSSRAIEIINVSAAVERITAATRSTRATAAAAPVLKTATGADIELFDFTGDHHKATNIVNHAAGSLETVLLRGAHRASSGGSPLAIATGLTILNVVSADLAYVSGNGLKSGAGSITHTNAYTEGSGVAVEDTFTGSNGTAIAGRTPSPTTAGNNWASFQGTSGNQTIQSNKASFACSNSSEGSFVDAGIADGVVTATVTFDASTSASAIVLFRATDSNNFWQVLVFATGIALYKTVSGSATLVDSETPTLTAGTPYLVTITLSGNSISAVVDSQPALTATDSFNATVTKHGVGGYSAGTGTITADGFSVSA